ncbi:hypothetical protein IW140_004205 [Coemansia sp. RSA 1813]|nr:hypothetical protein EV178_004307 [Coemansia sp. RSA 1646]KAJ1767062.1 hypothetical protein LPJ74_005567 [Coemansia sp. RSA 1843]KAJ2088058.1 hypothetical protein IW138_004478 [Coemansia sp. RSA 986]KAJ2210772.1 hypothetical protein EV179_006004 [Coemansia sp. RSA 487]KAJ2568034.1 hypothetical protein IW140_004205 [Coemansia sp. RSA 1813]
MSQSIESLRVGWIGLGNLGIEMAKNLQSYRSDNGLSPVTVYNRTTAKCQAVEQLGATVSSSPAKVALASDVVFLSLFNDDAVKSVVQEILTAVADKEKEQQARSSLSVPLVIADTTTMHPTMTQSLVDLINERQPELSRPVVFAQTPVWGAPPAAKARKLVLVTNKNSMAETVSAIAVPAFARTTIEVEDQVRAARFKIMGNFMIAAIIEALGEAMAVSHELGVSRETYLEFVKEVFPVPPVLGYATKLVDQGGEAAKTQVGFTVPGGMKDVGYAIDVAKSVGMRLPVAELAYEHLQWVNDNGNPDWDWSSLAYALRKEARPEN